MDKLKYNIIEALGGGGGYRMAKSIPVCTCNTIEALGVCVCVCVCEGGGGGVPYGKINMYM